MAIYIQSLFWLISALMCGAITGRLTAAAIWLLAFGAKSPLRLKVLPLSLLIGEMTILGAVLGMWSAVELHLLPAHTEPTWPSLINKWLYTLIFFEFTTCFFVFFLRSTHRKVRRMLSQISCGVHQVPRIVETGHYGPYAVIALAEWMRSQPKECLLVKPASPPVSERHYSLLRPVHKGIERWFLLRGSQKSLPIDCEEAPQVVEDLGDEAISK